MKEILKASVSTTANRLGTFLISIGAVPFLMYFADYVDLIRPGQRPEEFGLILMAVAPIALGLMLLKGKGDSISSAFLSWFGKRGS